MDEKYSLEKLIALVQDVEYLRYGLILLGALVVSMLSVFITRLILSRWLSAVAAKTKTSLDDILLKSGFLRRLSMLIPVIVFYSTHSLLGPISPLVLKLTKALFVVVMTRAIFSALTAFTLYWEQTPAVKKYPVKGYVQGIMLVGTIIASVLVISVLFDRSPLLLLSGMGAAAAILMLVFKDTILSLVASIQLSLNRSMGIGDWIQLPKYNVDGDVVDLTLNTVQVQNWDKTISVIPAHLFLTEAFKNYQGMHKAGGRRIKRTLFLDHTSIRFVTDKLLEELSRLDLIAEYIEQRQKIIEDFNKQRPGYSRHPANGRRQTNLGVFRRYVWQYLKTHPSVYQALTLLVRQLQPGAEGIPLEVYCFTNTTIWAEYEQIQSDIFDHLIAICPTFGLRIFQHPQGHDFQALKGVV